MAAEPESPEQLYDLAQPDPEHTLGGIKDDIEPDHPSVIGHIGELTCGPRPCGGDCHKDLYWTRRPVILLRAALRAA